MNKRKGFTLIELLAVIVILGLLMAIAIPSVTKYITESRKKTVISTIGNYITAMVNEVNDLTYTFTDANTIYAVPIECISLERGGTNPFGAWYQANDSYWAYVLVQYDDETSSYRYGYTFKDSAGYGLYPTAQSKLNEGGKQIKTGLNLTKPTNGKVTNITAVDNWNGFGVDSSTDLVVLVAESEGNIGDGINTCTLQQKGENYNDVEKGNNEEVVEDSLNSYGFYYNRLYRAFIDDIYVGFVFRKNNIVSMYLSEDENFDVFYDNGDIDIVKELNISYDMLPIYEVDKLIVGFQENGTKMLYEDVEFELTDIELIYSIQYSLNGGSVSKANPEKYNEKSKTFTLNNPTKEGYDFLGWTYGDSAEPQKNVTIESGSWGNRNYVANWQSNAEKLSNLIMKQNTLITAEPSHDYPSHTISDASGLYSSVLTNTEEPTYYFRGNVTNNYVSFAGFNWRIIRINEDGSIRILLENGINNNKTYKISTVENKFKYFYYTNSDIAKPELENWYKTNITDKKLDQFVITGKYCQQARVNGDYDSFYKFGSVIPNAEKYYTPDFKCVTDKNGYGVVDSKIGLMTYDEVVFAGLRGSWCRKDNYLIHEFDEYSFWTMSPGGIESNKYSYMWETRGCGALVKTSITQSLPVLRPVINLDSNVRATGDGTKDKPYVIQTN